MAFPKEITRRQKEEPDKLGKLEKELGLFYVLYTDWLHAKHDESGAPIWELRQIIAQDAKESAFRRMLDRYLLELKNCGAVCKTRVSKNGYCVAQFDENGPVIKDGLSDLHLNRLARTTALMRRFLDREPPPGYGLWSYDDVRFYFIVFFASSEEMAEWYEENFRIHDTQRRTMQRDMAVTWEVIREQRT